MYMCVCVYIYIYIYRHTQVSINASMPACYMFKSGRCDKARGCLIDRMDWPLKRPFVAKLQGAT